MRPHPDHLHGSFLVEDLVHEPMLDVDPARARAREIADELFEGRRRLAGVPREDFEERFDLLSHPGFRDVFESCVFRPRRIEARIPGIESR
jgi:hypothetical protein